jgi:hypothetical protein
MTRSLDVLRNVSRKDEETRRGDFVLLDNVYGRCDAVSRLYVLPQSLRQIYPWFSAWCYMAGPMSSGLGSGNGFVRVFILHKCPGTLSTLVLT